MFKARCNHSARAYFSSYHAYHITVKDYGYNEHFCYFGHVYFGALPPTVIVVEVKFSIIIVVATGECRGVGHHYVWGM
jgi:hypothetical protein